MQILELLNKAKEGYDTDAFLGQNYDPETGEFNPDGEGDTLAKFIVEELIGTFNPEASDESQLEEARRVIRNADYQLQDVVRALRS